MACTFAYGQAAANLEMTIDVYDYAGIDPGELAEAEAFAARVLHQAGHSDAVERLPVFSDSGKVRRRRWCNSSIHPPSARGNGGQARRFYANAGGITVHSPRYLSRGRVCFCRTRQRLRRTRSRSGTPLLGAAITHEVGHLLLAGNAHTVTGIMSAHWGPKEKKDALMEVLTFSRRQSEQIRTDVSQRMSGSNQRAQIAPEERRMEPKWTAASALTKASRRRFT